MSAQEAEQLWQEKGAAALESTAIDLTRDGRTVGSVTLAELGVTVKPLYISRAAGCDSASDHPLTVVESGWELLRSYLRPTDVTPQLDVDGAKLTDTCETLADTLDCTLVDGSYRLENGQGLYITKPRDGEKLDGGALRTLLEQRLAARDLSPAECVYRERQAAALDVQALHDELEGKTVSARMRQVHRQAHSVPCGRDVRRGGGAITAGCRRAGGGVFGRRGGAVPRRDHGGAGDGHVPGRAGDEHHQVCRTVGTPSEHQAGGQGHQRQHL